MKSRTLVSLVAPLIVIAVLLAVASLTAAGLFGASPAAAAPTSFPDVPDTHPNAVAIADLSGRGIISGFADGTFKPGNPVTRQQFAKMIVKTLGIPVASDIVCPFTDVDTTPSPADPNYPAKYVAVCAQEGITSGKTATTFDPSASITRQQLITMVVRAVEPADPPAGYTPAFTPARFSLEEHYQNARRAAYSGLLDDLELGSGSVFSAFATRGECAQILHNVLQSTGGGTTTTSPTSTTSTTVPAGWPAVDMLHFSWEWTVNWQTFRVENVSELAGGDAGQSARIIGDPYYYFETPDFPEDYIFATGENGDLLVFSAPSGGSDWKVRRLLAPSGARIRPLLGGRAFNDVSAATVKGGNKTLHVFATDADDNLLRFWLTQGGEWQAENVSAKTGRKVALMGSACTWEDYATVQVVGTTSAGDLVHFWLKEGGSWKSENVSQLVGKKIKGEASFNREADAGLGTAVVAAGPVSEFLIFHHSASGSWSVEDVTAATASGTTPGVTLGGWLSWWDWEATYYWDGSQFQNPVAVLDADGHLWLLERTSAAAPWTAANISALIGQTFRADTGGDSILRFHNASSIPAKEIHFAGANQAQDFVHFWRDAVGKWHSDNTTAKSGQKVAHPVNHYLTTTLGQTGGSTTWGDYVCAIAPNGDVVFIWDDVLLRNWKAFNVTAATGYKARPPELPWDGGTGSHLVFGGAE